MKKQSPQPRLPHEAEYKFGLTADSARPGQKARLAIYAALQSEYAPGSDCLDALQLTKLFSTFLCKSVLPGEGFAHLLTCAACRDDFVALLRDHVSQDENAAADSESVPTPPPFNISIFGSSSGATIASLQSEIADLNAHHARHIAELNFEHAEQVSKLRTSIADLTSRWRVEEQNFPARTEEHHQFVHAARDLVVTLLKSDAVRVFPDRAPIIPESIRSHIDKMLARMANTFQLTVPQGVQVYTSLRVREGDGYVTVARAGKVDQAARAARSQSLHQKSPAVQALRESFRDGECVLRTGDGALNWTPMANDGRGEDRSVLLGAIFSKKVSAKNLSLFVPCKLEWIIGVAADREHAFGDQHRALMRAFGDTFGLILNVLTRRPELAGAVESDDGD